MKTRSRLRKQLGKRSFNMIEIVIALVIILVVLIGILGLIPDSMEASANALSRTSAIDGADQFLHYIGSRIETDWSIADALPDARPELDEIDIVWSRTSMISNQTAEDDSMELQIQFDTQGGDEVWSPTAHINGMYRVVQTTQDGSITDFVGVVRVWKEVFEITPNGELVLWGGVTDDVTDDTGGSTTIDGSTDPNDMDEFTRDGKVYLAHYPRGRKGAKCITLHVSQNAVPGLLTASPYNHLGFCKDDVTYDEDGNVVLTVPALVAVLNAEVSWPAHVPYERRNKKSYRLEIAKPSVTFSDSGETVTGTNPDQDDETGDDGTNDDGIFVIEDGAVILSTDRRTGVQVLGASLKQGGKDCYITTYFNINGTIVTPFGDPSNPIQGNVNDGSQRSFDAGTLEAGSAVSAVGSSYLPNGNLIMERSSAPSNQNVLVLRNGDPIPSNLAANPNTYVANYIDTSTNTAKLDPDKAILLFELGTNNMNSPDADFQDLVILVTMTPAN